LEVKRQCGSFRVTTAKGYCSRLDVEFNFKYVDVKFEKKILPTYTRTTSASA